jgi:hypothetical protein
MGRTFIFIPPPPLMFVLYGESLMEYAGVHKMTLPPMAIPGGRAAPVRAVAARRRGVLGATGAVRAPELRGAAAGARRGRYAHNPHRSLCATARVRPLTPTSSARRWRRGGGDPGGLRVRHHAGADDGPGEIRARSRRCLRKREMPILSVDLV